MKMPEQIKVQISLDEFKQIFGEKNWEMSLKMAKVMKAYLDADENFTGKIVFNVNCRHGGIGNVETFVQKKFNIE